MGNALGTFPQNRVPANNIRYKVEHLNNRSGNGLPKEMFYDKNRKEKNGAHSKKKRFFPWGKARWGVVIMTVSVVRVMIMVVVSAA